MSTLETINLKFEEPSVTLIHQSDPYKMIELAGRTCYKSEDKITKDSAIKFVRALLSHGHTAMIEHAVLTFKLTCQEHNKNDLIEYVDMLDKQEFIRVTHDESYDRVLVSGNVRAIVERNLYDPIYSTLINLYPEFAVGANYTDDISNIIKTVSAVVVNPSKIKDLTKEEFLNHFTLSARFLTDRGVSHEIVRHRLFSFAQESTRYCNYTKGKFGGKLTFCLPTRYNYWSDTKKSKFLSLLEIVDSTYFDLVSGDDGLSPQDARSILSNCLKTEIVITGPAFEWQNFFNLRSNGVSGSPHPDMKFVSDIAKKKMNKYLYSLKFVDNHHFK